MNHQVVTIRSMYVVEVSSHRPWDGTLCREEKIKAKVVAVVI